MSDISPPAKGEEAQLIRFLEAVDGEAEASKREVSRYWEDSIKQVRGDQWRLKRSPYFMANIIKNQVRRKTSTLTESKPQIQVSAQREKLSLAAEVIYNATKSIWDRSNTEDAIGRLAQFAMTMGSGFLGAVYDPLINDVEIMFIDSRRVFVDPGIYSAPDLDKAQYLRIDTILSLADIRTRFPGRGALVKPTDRFSSFGDGRRTTSILSSVLSMMPRPYRPGTATKSGPIPRAELREYWIRDPQTNTEGKLLFPGGRHIVRSGNVILLDEANPYWDGLWPLEMFEWDMDYDTPWGLDEVQDLRRIQEAVNRLGDAWVQNRLLGSNFRIIADLDALDPDQWEKLDNEAGLIIREKPQRQFEYQPPVPDDGSMPQTINMLIQLMDLLTGNQGDRGDKSPAQGSASYEGLQMARQVLIRAIARRLEAMLERLGQKLVSRIFQFYTADKILFQQGSSHQWIAYTFERQRLLSDDAGNMRSIEDRQTMWRDFKFMITPFSSLAMTRVQRTMAALQLRSATGFVPSVKRIMAEADMGDADELIREGLEELKTLPPPPVPKGRGGRP